MAELESPLPVLDALESQALLEEKYGSKEGAEKIRAKKPKVEAVKEPIKDENIEIVADIKNPELTVKKEEKKVEPKEIVTEVKTEEKKTEPKVAEKKEEKKVEPFYDPLEKRKEKKVEVKPLEESVKEKPIADLEKDINYANYKKKAEAFDSFQGTPLFPVLESIAKNGGDIYGALRELLPKDYANMPDEARAREYFTKARGITDQAKVDALVQQYLQYENGSLEKEDMDDRHINALNLLEKDRIAQSATKINSNAERQNNTLSQFVSEIPDVIKDFKKNAPLGLRVPTEEYGDFENLIKSGSVIAINPDGTIDTVKTATAQLLLEYAPKRLREIFLNGHFKGADTALEAVIQPDRNEEGTHHIPKKEEKSDVQRIDERYGKRV